MPRVPRVLLLEDDARIRRFVAMALDGLGLELVECPAVAQALAEFERAPVDVALCDLMLAGESGFDLIERIVAHPVWRATQVIVFSAADDAQDRQRMHSLGVTRQLSKPASVAALVACVESALPGRSDELAATSRFFQGDAALFRAYREASRGQLRRDVAQGDAWCAEGDAGAMRRLAHSLKSAVGLLGAAPLSAQCAEIEKAARDGRLDEVRRLWHPVREALLRLA